MELNFTLGFDTCLNTILDAMCQKIRDTATSHERTVLIEVMGREAELALHACLAVVTVSWYQEMDNPIEMLALQLNARRKAGKLHDIILVSERC